MINTFDLDAILALAAKATKGPWIRSGVRKKLQADCLMVGRDDFLIAGVPIGNDNPGAFSDAGFIAACDPQTITSLILELQSLRTQRDIITASNTKLAALLATSIEDRSAINARLKEVEGERDEAREERDEAIKAAETADDVVYQEGFDEGMDSAKGVYADLWRSLTRLLRSRNALSETDEEGHSVSDMLDGVLEMERTAAPNAVARAEAAESELALVSGSGWKLVPVEPTEEQWGGLARAIVMWWGMDSQPTGEKLYVHLQRTGEDIPDWLTTEIPDQAHVPPKGTVAACIYRAMLEAAPLPPSPKGGINGR